MSTGRGSTVTRTESSRSVGKTQVVRVTEPNTIANAAVPRGGRIRWDPGKLGLIYSDRPPGPRRRASQSPAALELQVLRHHRLRRPCGRDVQHQYAAAPHAAERLFAGVQQLLRRRLAKRIARRLRPKRRYA